ncbi:hypothetical protein GUITHDRAFT_99868 [Guillardia theta CCMP2712]|uniref:Uncharacterized protein n=1 Tax=Guillardia theta (strain CCMP2712) TaxID=905079 RepID=L1K0N0_GUITC|nr:hypothetical protein GUITHDRAFT_99868 [Guillardia theta CCMP2712]EKX54386.1 hypothetical protein GUITHDRAFT_99868 [Guillardia theta CCMP2712]|eukprot:XP_005841366.1 hypothetical protein GUITHDRAFT_99868 [Guillardia theta CCMP2712]
MATTKLNAALLFYFCTEIASQDMSMSDSPSKSYDSEENLGHIRARARKLYRIANVEFLKLQKRVFESMEVTDSKEMRNRRLSEEIARKHPLDLSTANNMQEDGISSQLTRNDTPPQYEEEGEMTLGMIWPPHGPTEEAV